MPKISVIVPVYNSSKHLKTCLNSLIYQTLDDIEIIVIDDASTDNSLDIIREYSKYPNVKIYHNETNLGQGMARNIGISKARGKYIGFLDSDDYVNKNMYKNMYENALNNDNPDIIVTGLRFVKDNSCVFDEYNYVDKGLVYNISKNPNVVLSQSPSLCNKIFKSELIKGYKLLDTLWEDIAFTYTNLFKANKVLVTNNSDYFYRRNIENGVSSQGYKPSKKIFEIFKVANEIEDELKKCGKYKQYKSQVKFLQIAITLQRVQEIETWNISEVDTIKGIMFQTILEKYGDLSDVDKDFLSSKVSLDVIDEYEYFSRKNIKSL